MAWACEAVYQNGKDEMISRMRTFNERIVDVIPVYQDNAVAAIVEHEDFRIWVYRGTDDIQDWIDNLDVEADHNWHHGFFRHYKKTLEVMKNNHSLLIDERGIKPLYFTGHSLGGACAAIAAMEAEYYQCRDLKLKGSPLTTQPRALITFGAPRVFTKEGQIRAGKAKFPYYRFRRCGDIVPRVPPRALHFYHAGVGVYMDRKRRAHMDWEWWNRLADRILGWRKSIQPASMHSVMEYLVDMSTWRRIRQ